VSDENELPDHVQSFIDNPEQYASWSVELGDKFCELIAAGLTMDQAMRYPGMPATKNTIYAWLHKYPDFKEKYKIAKMARVESYVDEMIEIADDCTDDITMGVNGPMIKTSSIRRAALRIDTRKWIAARINPDYNEKLVNEHTGPGGAALGNTIVQFTLLPTGTVLPKPEADPVAEFVEQVKTEDA